MRTTSSAEQQVLARNIRRARELKGWSQEELARRAGMERAYLSGIERAQANPSLLKMTSIAHQLGCDVSTLLTPGGDAEASDQQLREVVRAIVKTLDEADLLAAH
ncbi:helix-turn-helix domain-containing protein [Sphingomonas sp.]|uniref:helix-turn-helix domain-containing protein n=1 Tax=Sphingomonas sp. TaxID=28214 RepID=UPI0035C7E448